MTQELTVYILFIMLTVSMGIVFQFMLGKIRSLTNTQKRIINSLHSIHGDVVEIRKKETIVEPRINNNNVLRGDLTLEYRGAIADTRATFMLDKK
jgi:hypothetical protein